MCRTFLRKNCIRYATVNPVYPCATHTHTHMLHAHTFYHAHLLSQMEGNYDVDVFQPSKDLQFQTALYFISHYVKIVRFPLRPFIYTYLLGNRVLIHFFFVIRYDKCFQSCSKRKKEPYKKKVILQLQSK